MWSAHVSIPPPLNGDYRVAQACGRANDGKATVGGDHDTSGVGQAHEPSSGGLPGLLPACQDDRPHDRYARSSIWAPGIRNVSCLRFRLRGNSHLAWN